jgi:rubredoxin
VNDIVSPPPSYYEPPDDDWGVCPDCGASQEDSDRVWSSDKYLCGCGSVYTDEQAHPDPRDDEPTLPGDE